MRRVSTGQAIFHHDDDTCHPHKIASHPFALPRKTVTATLGRVSTHGVDEISSALLFAKKNTKKKSASLLNPCAQQEAPSVGFTTANNATGPWKPYTFFPQASIPLHVCTVRHGTLRAKPLTGLRLQQWPDAVPYCTFALSRDRTQKRACA